MNTQNWQELSMFAKAWVKEAGLRIRESFSEELIIQFKQNPSDLVTEMDKQTEQFFIERIRQYYPDHTVLSEEGFGDEVNNLTGIVWMIDPIDGTMNFVHMQRHFAISIGIYFNGVGMIGIIYDVVADEMYEAIKGQGAFFNSKKLPQLEPVPIREAVISMNAAWAVNEKRINPQILPPLVRALRGTRSLGSAAIEMAYVAANRIDGYLTLRLSPWDFAAGRIIIEEVGGKVTTIDGKPLQMLSQNSVFVAKPGLHEEVSEKFLRSKD
jgi:myo-inositol-1(or 4)-monophosphatase